MIMNNNTTLEICVNNSGYDKSLYTSDIVWHVSGFIGIIVGIPGHILQIIILSNKINKKEPTSLYFIAIAVCELIFLLALFWLWCANMSFIKLDPRHVLSCGVFYTILIGSTTLSNLYLASLSIDRTIMILRPTQYRIIVTRSHVKLRLILIYIIIVILLIPHYFYYEPRTTLFLCDFQSSVIHRKIRLWSYIHAILFVSIPSLIVCISGCILLHNRCKHKRIHKRTLSKNARRMHRRSIFIFFITLWIFLSLLPLCILEIFIVYDGYFNYDRYCSIRWKIYKILLNCFITLSLINYSMKFYVHLIMSPAFRKNFIQFIHCKYNQNIPGSPRTDNGSTNEQNLLPAIVLDKIKSQDL